jgi:hypothetical protein
VTKYRAISAVAVAAAMALFAAGCTGDPAPSVPTGPDSTNTAASNVSATPDPCQLVTEAEVSAAVGVEVKIEAPADPTGLPGQRTCFYHKPESVSMVSVAVWPADSTMFTSMKTAAGDVTDIPGVGDGAYGEPRAIWVLRGKWMINIAILGFGDVTTTEPIQAISRAAAGRLT